MERGKAAECRKHGWAQAATDHDLKAQQLEYEIWADLTTASFDAPQAKAAAPVPVSAGSGNATATPPTTAYPSSADPGQQRRSSVTEGTSWPPQQQMAPVDSSPLPTPPPPAYSDIYPNGQQPQQR